MTLEVEEAQAVIVEFLDSWRFCPVSQASGASRSCLEDAAKQLLAALGQPVEARTEYRVAGRTPELPPLDDGGNPFFSHPVDTLYRAARQVAAERGYGSTDLRIQSRAVTESDWTDLPEEEQG